MVHFKLSSQHHEQWWIDKCFRSKIKANQLFNQSIIQVFFKRIDKKKWVFLPRLFSIVKRHALFSYCHYWASVVCPSVNISHFNQLLWSHWVNLNQTLVKWSLDVPLPKLCPVIPTSNKDGRQAKNWKKRDAILIVHCCFSICQNEVKF